MKTKQRLSAWGLTFLLMGLGGLAQGASVATLPESEDFQSGELPHDYTINTGPPFYFWLPVSTPWSFTTNGEARTTIAYDETDTETQLIPQSIPPQYSTAENYSRGQFYACTSSGALVSAGIDLNRSSSVNVAFFVYESASSNGTYTLIYSDTVSAATGNGVVQSSGGNIPMHEGMFYLIGAGWDINCQYLYESAGEHPNTFPLGYTLGGYANNTTSAPPSSVTGTYSATAYQQTLVFSTNAVVRMDDVSGNTTYSTNQMDLAVNLSGYTDVTLKFRHRDSSDEITGDAAGDGIFLSDDSGVTFMEVYSLGASASWQTITLDIFTLAINNGLSPNENFVIRFQQVDNYGWPSDGREFDDIKVFSKPDLDVTSFGVANAFLWKGFNDVKEVPLSVMTYGRGGEDYLSAPSVKYRYGFRDYHVPNAVLDFEYDTESWTIPAMTTVSASYNHTLTIPAATHLVDLYYEASVYSDSQDDVDEGNESNNYRTEQVTVNHYSGWLWFDDVKADITISDWGTRVVDSASEHWITGTGIIDGESFPFTHLDVDKNLTTLDYSVDPAETMVITVPFADRYLVSDVTYWRVGGVELSRYGAYADIKVLFPAGLGVSTASSKFLDATYTFENRKLAQGLYPGGVVFKSGAFKVVEESKPVGYTATEMRWNPEAGTFLFTRDGIWSVRDEHYDWLENRSGDFVDSKMAEKKSNAAYYREVAQLLSDPLVETGANGEAQLSAQIGIDPASLIAHFPYGVQQTWAVGTTLTIVQDLVDTGTSHFDGLADCSLSYTRNCNENMECSGHYGLGILSCSANGKTYVGMDGGLVTDVNITSGGALQWGSRFNGSITEFSQSTEAFGSGNLYIAGHFIRGDLSGFSATEQRGPAEILLSGMASSPERPSTASYQDGLADYAGLNLRVGGATITADSIIGGEHAQNWTLTSRSKYYARYSGVSGIHEAVPGTFPPTMTIYEYPFAFSNYGLSYLSGEPEESRINGNVAVPIPCDIAMDFKNLMLNCLGELGEAELANAGMKTLKYWDADIQPLTLFFAPTAKSSCGNSARKLCMGLTTQCANVDQTLSGVLGFMSSGELGTPEDQIEGVPSRLAAPNKIELAGPADEIYYFNPVAMPYFNTYSSSGDSMSQLGWINFAGNLDVSFFSDLQVHFHTSASTNSAVANIYMMGGWESGGDTFFDSNPDRFDTENRGFPSAADSYASYRTPTPTNNTYRVHALRTWLGVIDFDYPLQWSTATKAFKSPEELEEDLLVVQVQHQTDYLSAENTEISFGLQYDGVPQINLANMAFNAVDEGTGMMSAFTDAVGNEIHSAIDEGMSAFDDTLSDLPEMLFDPIFVEVLDPIVGEFYGTLYDAYMAQPTGTDYGTVVTQYIHGVGGSSVYGDVHTILVDLGDAAATSVNILSKIDENLGKAVQLINAFADVVSMTNGVALPPDLQVDGLLSIDGGDYQKLTDLGIGILAELSETLYDSIKGTIQEELTSVLNSVAPSLESITEVMLELRDVIVDVQTELQSVGSVAAEISDTLNSPLVQDTANVISDEIMTWIETNLESGGDSVFDEYTPEEMKAMLRMQITDAFYGSMPCADVQQIIRSQLYEVEAMVQESIDSAFQQLNLAMKGLVSEYLAGIDEEINGALGDLSDIMGAGQIEGYAHIRHDSLNELRLDGKFQWEVPDEMEFNAFLIIKDLNSSMPGGCGVDADSLPEVTLGTTDFGMSMMGSDIRADIATKFAFVETGGSLRLIGMGGSFEMTEGEMGFESFSIDEFYAAVAFGALENYLSANIHCTFTSYEVEGGIFLGKSCSLDPFSWDPDVQAVLGEPPFTGIYVYGEGWMPIIDFGCVFRVKAGVGAGFFAFENGLVGGKIFLGADGEALCVVNVSGEVTLIGTKQGDDMRMNGKGKISGRAGSCPFCVKFSKTVTISYDNGDWDADY